MESLQNIKRRLKSVKNIGQITKAMELVAATKMRKSQEAALISRPYAYSALELLAHLSQAETEYIPPFLKKRAITNTAIVVISSDKGLAGSFNSAVFRMFEKEITHSKTTCYFAVGTKSLQFLERKGYPVQNFYTSFGDITKMEETHALSDDLLEGYLAHKWDRVLVLSTNFRSALSQDVVMREVFPITFESLQKTAEEIIPQTGRFREEFEGRGFPFFGEKNIAPDSMEKEREYIIEPSPAEALEALLPHLIRMQIYHIVLEANASEHAARRMAMKSASDNAGDIVDTLTIEYNKSRQAGITRELTEITAGAEAL